MDELILAGELHWDFHFFCLAYMVHIFSPSLVFIGFEFSQYYFVTVKIEGLLSMIYVSGSPKGFIHSAMVVELFRVRFCRFYPDRDECYNNLSAMETFCVFFWVGGVDLLT